ncbi:hypothetical protein PISMIDRAFT_684982 [Pisolithus microcarpus 441]|uniref:Uncharacterized protein n=1 Tax=Pisolithus microcarpus 441 TaxID=765257 RepID=A0A0C9XYY4_9AGAM|nr:hypothetical protein PISMIDRAFT_684982 [Pisolithus microcarpus 441]
MYRKLFLSHSHAKWPWSSTLVPAVLGVLAKAPRSQRWYFPLNQPSLIQLKQGHWLKHI